jgi:hypothetical protein
MVIPARGQLFLMRIPKADNDLGAEMSVFFASTPSSSRGEKQRSYTFLRAGFAMDGKEVPFPLVVECAGWKRDEWHHIAVTWEGGRRMTVYLDNRKAGAERDFPTSIERDIPESAQIIIGSPDDQQPNGLTIDEFRLSSVARPREELGVQQTPLRPDPFTMLLENFENVQPANGNAKYTATPTVIAFESAPKTCDISGGRLVPGKFGQAWKISDPS